MVLIFESIFLVFKVDLRRLLGVYVLSTAAICSNVVGTRSEWESLDASAIICTFR